MTDKPVDPDTMLDDLAAGVAAKDRAVFDPLLAALVTTANQAWTDGPKALIASAKKSPDRFAQTLVILANLSGFNERLEVTASPGLLGYVQKIQNMPAAELDAELERLRKLASAEPYATKRVLTGS